MLEVKDAPALDAVEEPAKQWRNLYRTHVAMNSPTLGLLPPGEHWSAYVWPSREIAEQKASYSVAGLGCEWLGAYPANNVPDKER